MRVDFMTIKTLLSMDFTIFKQFSFCISKDQLVFVLGMLISSSLLSFTSSQIKYRYFSSILRSFIFLLLSSFWNHSIFPKYSSHHSHSRVFFSFFFSFLRKSKYFSIVSFSFIFLPWSTRTINSFRGQIFFFFVKSSFLVKISGLLLLLLLL